ncbi:exosortase H [Marinicella litoralis]|uniref:Exosortase H (IPTLxxWG-CTERM-specific) n=1 Tax=Marinicella litoralis TaxID=644220 RepID=A0A4R6Y2H8_9GAMM|nr:exosortase H [Marinicella litoralis]TDR23188.1 exosortase H (IPTLxxWG-CTERM-specific) [Marinicella litoralis]
MLRFSVLFITLILGLFILEIYEPVRQAVILPFTSMIATACSWMIQLFDSNVIAEGDIIRNAVTYQGIQIAPGCNGVEAMIILFAALMAFPSSFGYKLKGLFWGFIAIQALNSVRIISLFYLLQWDKVWFDWFHLYLWQALIILDALVVWLIWLRYLPKNSDKSNISDNNNDQLAASESAA